MVKIKLVKGEIKVTGTFDMGYAGLYKDEQIKIYDSIDKIRAWNIVCNSLPADCDDEDIVEFLTKYFNEYENKLQANIKLVNDNLLLNTFEDMYNCGNMFYCEDTWTVEGYVPESEEELDDYDPYENETIEDLLEMNSGLPNDGSVEKADVEKSLRENYPVFNWDKLISSIVPEFLSLQDGSISFQCSDGVDNEILCGGYDVLDEQLTFTEWHNF